MTERNKQQWSNEKQLNKNHLYKYFHQEQIREEYLRIFSVLCC